MDNNLLARYDNNEKVLDLVEFDQKRRTVCAVAEVSLGAAELPPLHSIHHFMVKTDSYLFCLASDRRRYIVFKTTGKRFGPPTTGTLLMQPTHCVVFKYRNFYYLLCYRSTTGEYNVVTMAPLCNDRCGSTSLPR